MTSCIDTWDHFIWYQIHLRLVTFIWDVHWSFHLINQTIAIYFLFHKWAINFKLVICAIIFPNVTYDNTSLQLLVYQYQRLKSIALKMYLWKGTFDLILLLRQFGHCFLVFGHCSIPVICTFNNNIKTHHNSIH